MSAACRKRLDEPAGSSCRQPTALKTEPHNVSDLAEALVEEFAHA